jgi:hypothetical protein
MAHRRLSQAFPASRATRLPNHAIDTLILVTFIAAILGTNHALSSLPNIKLFDLFVFVAAYSLGVKRGAAIAASAWIIYGSFNPYGVTTPTLLISVITAEFIYVTAAVVARQILPPNEVNMTSTKTLIVLFACAVLGTLLYDISTNIYTGWAWSQASASSDYGRWIRLALFNPGAIAFSISHIASNIIFFVTLAPLLIKGVQKLR